MCAAKKNEEIHEPTLAGLILGAVGGLFIGLALAAGNLATQTVDSVREIPEPERQIPKMVYFVQGRDTGSNFQARQQAIMQGVSPVEIYEADLNTWARTAFREQAAAKDEGIGIGSLQLGLKPAPPTFRVADDKFQIGSLLDITVYKKRSIIFQAHGKFTNGPTGPVYQPERVHIGRCPVPPILGLQKLALNIVAKPFIQAEGIQELKDAYRDYKTIEIERDALVLRK